MVNSFPYFIDPIVPIDSFRQAVTQLQAANLNVKLSEYEGVGHATPLEMRIAILEEFMQF